MFYSIRDRRVAFVDSMEISKFQEKLDKIEVIDVTLRDGGYRNNFNFAFDHVAHIISLLDQAGIEYIEVGYKNGSFKPIDRIGVSGISPPDYLNFCKSHMTNSKMAVIFHPHNLKLNDIDELAKSNVDLVRICLPISNLSSGFAYIERAKSMGFEVSVNLTRVSQYKLDEIRKAISNISKLDVNIICLADSNGSLTPAETYKIFDEIKSESPVSLGFHAHNNLDLALANSVEAISSGVKYIDASLMGMGKGSGNLKQKSLIGYLHAYGNKKYKLLNILKAQMFVVNNIPESLPSIFPQDLILAIMNLSQDDAGKVGEYNDLEDYISKINRLFT